MKNCLSQEIIRTKMQNTEIIYISLNLNATKSIWNSLKDYLRLKRLNQTLDTLFEPPKQNYINHYTKKIIESEMHEAFTMLCCGCEERIQQ